MLRTLSLQSFREICRHGYGSTPHQQAGLARLHRPSFRFQIIPDRGSERSCRQAANAPCWAVPYLTTIDLAFRGAVLVHPCGTTFLRKRDQNPWPGMLAPPTGLARPPHSRVAFI